MVSGCRALLGVLDLLPVYWCMSDLHGPYGDRVLSRAGMGSGSLKAASLLVCGTASLPSWLLGLRGSSTGIYGLVGGGKPGSCFNKLEGSFQDVL